MSAAEEVLADYRTAGLSLRAHPMQFLRQRLAERGVQAAKSLATLPNGRPVRVAGIVLVRQRPGTAKGITFVTLEDETGTANLIIRPAVWKRFREAAHASTLMLAEGPLQHQGQVIHVLAARLEDLSPWLQQLGGQSRDFRLTVLDSPVETKSGRFTTDIGLAWCPTTAPTKPRHACSVGLKASHGGRFASIIIIARKTLQPPSRFRH